MVKKAKWKGKLQEISCGRLEVDAIFIHPYCEVQHLSPVFESEHVLHLFYQEDTAEVIVLQFPDSSLKNLAGFTSHKALLREN